MPFRAPVRACRDVMNFAGLRLGSGRSPRGRYGAVARAMARAPGMRPGEASGGVGGA